MFLCKLCDKGVARSMTIMLHSLNFKILEEEEEARYIYNGW